MNNFLKPLILALVLTAATGLAWSVRKSEAKWIPMSVRSGSLGGGFTGGGFSGGK